MKPRLYLFEFWDHTKGRCEMKCRVAGWIVKETKRTYKITSWLSGDEPEDQLEPSNLEPFNILKSTVVKKKRLYY